MTFGEKLQKLRKENGWTQEQLAAHIHVSRQALSKWEQGTAIPDTENVLQLSRLFKVSTDYLLHEDYNSDADLPAVHARDQKLKNMIRVIAGVCLAGVSLLGMLILGILSSVFPAVCTYSEPGADWVRFYTGLPGFLMYHNLEWLFILCIFTLLIGLITIWYPKCKGYLNRVKRWITAPCLKKKQKDDTTSI